MVSYGYKINYANKKEREMKKFMLFAGIIGVVLMSGAAMADINQIKTATTNTVKKTVYGIQYGEAGTIAGGQLDQRGYRKGVIPQGSELTTAIGNTVPPVVTGSIDEGGAISVGGSNVAVGHLPATTSSAVDGTYNPNDPAYNTSNPAKPTATVTANTANIAVLQRDKLVTPGATGSCDASDSTHPCGYVTTGTHKNTSADRVWLKVALAADAQQQSSQQQP